MKKTDFSVSLRDGARKRLKQYSRLLSQSLSVSLLLLTLSWLTPAIGQNCSLGCHGAQVSLGQDCTAEVTVAMIGETGQCPNGQFTVFVSTLNGDTIPTSPVVTFDQIGMTLIASVYDNISHNSCWSYITVQDKFKPQMDCDCTPVGHIDGALTAQDPTFFNNDPCWQFGCCVPTAAAKYYDTWNFQIAVAGMYSFTFSGSLFDAMGAVYEDSFNPLDICTNLLGGDDDNGNFLDPHVVIQLNMVPGDYVFVTTTWGSQETGVYSWWIDGPGEVFNGDEDCFRNCAEIGPGYPAPLAIDNCDSDPTVIKLYEDTQVLCHPQFTKKLTRKWTAIDANGNRADTCTQVFYLERIDFDDIVWPIPYSSATMNPFICGQPFTDVNPADGIPDAIPVSQGGAGVPTINGVPIYPDFIDFCNASVSLQEVPIGSSSCVKKIMRIWSVNEWHCSGEVDTLYSQLVEVIDNLPPVVVCPANFSHSTSGNSCVANIWIPQATATDNCSGVQYVTTAYPGGFKSQNGLFYAPLPVGINVITYTAYDFCGRSSTCSMEIEILDLTPPVPVCDEHTIVSLTVGGPQGLTLVNASVFDDGSYDDCGAVTFRARRMTSCIEFDWTTEGSGYDATPNGEVNSRDRGTVLRPMVPFACCDANNGPIMVELEVMDLSGNVNYCMVEVRVQDKIKPTITCPSDITISCDYPLNVDDLSAFGNVVRDQHDVQEWCVYDPTNPLADDDGFVCGTDGIAVDNCDIEISVTMSNDINNCGVGTITRVWRAADSNGADLCTQRIEIINFDPLDNFRIDWPDDYHGLECSEGTDPDELPYPYNRPLFDEDHCDLVGVTYDDVVFPFVNGVCFKILRTWKIIEWCLYEELGGIVEGENYWEHTQVIKVLSSNGPEFITSQPTIDECNYEDCGGIALELTQRAEDDCTADNLLRNSWAVDLNNDNSIDLGPFNNTGAVINISRTFQLGNHRVIYTFEDGCGNRTVREQFLNLESCKAPTPVCHFLSTNLGVAGAVTIWVSDFDASSFHACGSPFDLSFSPNSLVISRVFTCDDMPTPNAPIDVTIYATDNLGNQDHCTTTILLTDNAGVCGQGFTGTITGNVSTETSENVLDVEVQVQGSPLLPLKTSQTGMYTFPSMAVGGNYVVAPGKNNDYRNGVSTLDLVVIQKHLLGISDLSSPYKMIAADVNNSESITAVDLIELRKLILGIYTELPNNSSWRFVDKTYTFPNEYNPWMEIWPETHALSPLSQGMNYANFFGVKVGDVNNTVKANATSVLPRGSGQVLDLVIDDRAVNAGEVIEVPVYAGANNTLEGLQFSFDLGQGLELVGVSAGLLDVDNTNFGWLQNHVLTSSWNNAESIQVDGDSPLFTLVLQAKSGAKLSQAISIITNPTPAEAYSAGSDIMDIALSFRGSEDRFDFELLQNEPNPFIDFTQIGFVLPESGKATLTLFDVTGKQLVNQTVDGVKGLNKIEVNKTQISANGIIYYQVQFQGYTATKKMLIL